MKKSSPPSELDFTRGVSTTPEDAAALKNVRAARTLTTEQYLLALARLPAPPLELLRARKRARGGEPFRLPPG